MNCGTVVTGSDGLTTMTSGTRKMPATGAMSRTKLKLRLSYRVSLIALAAMAVSSV